MKVTMLISYAVVDRDGNVVESLADLVPHRQDVDLNPEYAGLMSDRTALFLESDGQTVISMAPMGPSESINSRRLRHLRRGAPKVRIIRRFTVELVRRDPLTGVYAQWAVA